MESNLNRRSASSGSRSQKGARASASNRNKRSQRASARPSSIKGRPSTNRSVRISQGTSSFRTRSVYGQTGRSEQSAQRLSARASQNSFHESARARSDSGVPLRSVRVSEVTRASRAQNRSERSSSPLKKVLIGLLLVIFAVIICLVVAVSLNLLPVKKVTVSGISHISQQELTDLAAVSHDSTLINVDVAGIEERLKKNPWIESVQVERVPPDTINLNITERTIAAVVEVLVDDSKTTETWALASDGTWLTKIPNRESDEGKQFPESIYADADKVLKISQVPYGSVPVAGEQCKNANVSNALSVIDGMTTELSEQVKQVNASSSESTTLVLNNGVEIAFGDSSDIRDKERVCLTLLEEHSGEISYINVRDASRPVWRSV